MKTEKCPVYIDPAIRRGRKATYIAAVILPKIAEVLREEYPLLNVQPLERLDDPFFYMEIEHIIKMIERLTGENMTQTQEIAVNINSFLSEDSLITHGAGNDGRNITQSVD